MEGSPPNTPLAPPLYPSAAWSFKDLDEVDQAYQEGPPWVIYGRNGTPNTRALEALFAQAHQAPEALLCASGMAAFSAVFLGLLAPGDRVVASLDLYGSTVNLLEDLARWGLEGRFVDLDRLREEDLAGARLLIVESLSNPRLRIPELPELVAWAHRQGALVLVDNTFATSYHLQPLRYGADLVLESLTKFFNGHSDVTLGALAGSSELIGRLRGWAVRSGLVGNPWEAWLAQRGAETLRPRMAQASATAARLAAFLAEHPEVQRVHYPGLPSYPDHLRAQRLLQGGFGAMLSFELEPSRPRVQRFLRRLRQIRLVLSLGGASTTLSHPLTSSHRFLSPQAQKALGLHMGFLRLSVGLEPLEELQDDLSRALD
jgi:cystathionine beta-lyase/cystathionine gamma-synthase